MIHKKLHYCWFGDNPKNAHVIKCILSWKKYCPDYEIIEWNDNNFPLEECPQYVMQAYKERKYAFVSDYARLKILYDHGGFYMDTDVELLKPLDNFLEDYAVLGFENDNYVNSGQMLAAEAGHPILKEMMEQYRNISFYHQDGSINLLICTRVNTDVLVTHGLKKNGKEQIVANVHVYPEDYFNPLDSVTGELRKTQNTVSIHWYSMSWKSPVVRFRVRLLRPVRRFLLKISRKS